MNTVFYDFKLHLNKRSNKMKNLTIAHSILFGLSLIALSVASIPYSNLLVRQAVAQSDKVYKIAICKSSGYPCADIVGGGRLKVTH